MFICLFLHLITNQSFVNRSINLKNYQYGLVFEMFETVCRF